MKKIIEIRKTTEYNSFNVVYVRKIDKNFSGMNYFAAKELGVEFVWKEDVIIISLDRLYNFQKDGFKSESDYLFWLLEHESKEALKMKNGCDYIRAHSNTLVEMRDCKSLDKAIKDAKINKWVCSRHFLVRLVSSLI